MSEIPIFGRPDTEEDWLDAIVVVDAGGGCGLEINLPDLDGSRRKSEVRLTDPGPAGYSGSSRALSSALLHIAGHRHQRPQRRSTRSENGLTPAAILLPRFAFRSRTV